MSGWRQRVALRAKQSASVKSAALTVLALMVGVSAWAAVRVWSVTDVPLVMLVVGEEPLSGKVTFETAIPFERARVRRVLPEQVTPLSPRQEVNVTVTPMGKRNPASGGSEVWVRSVSSDVETVSAERWADFAAPDGWKVESGSMLAAGEARPLEVPLRATGYVDVTLLSHPWSGSVRISAGGEARVVDLYSSETADKVIRVFPPLSTAATQRIVMDLPSSTESFTVGFEGPEVVRLDRASWGEGEDLPGVQDASGSVSFGDLVVEPFWALGADDLAYIGLVTVLAFAAIMGLRADVEAGGFLRRLWVTSPAREPRPTPSAQHSSEVQARPSDGR